MLGQALAYAHGLVVLVQEEVPWILKVSLVGHSEPTCTSTNQTVHRVKLVQGASAEDEAFGALQLSE